MEKHYVGHCLLKCCQAVLASRAKHTTSPDKRRSRWFLLELEEVPAAAPLLEPSKKDVYAPLILEVYLPLDQLCSPPPPGLVPSRAGHVFLERWVLQYGPQATTSAIPSTQQSKASSSGQSPRQHLHGLASSAPSMVASSSSSSGGGGGPSGRSYTDDASVYKRLTLLVRALYAHLRVLPTFRIARSAKRCQGSNSACSGGSSGGGSGGVGGLEFAVRRDGVLVGGSSVGVEAASQAWHPPPPAAAPLAHPAAPVGPRTPPTQEFPTASASIPLPQCVRAGTVREPSPAAGAVSAVSRPAPDSSGPAHIGPNEAGLLEPTTTAALDKQTGHGSKEAPVPKAAGMHKQAGAPAADGEGLLSEHFSFAPVHTAGGSLRVSVEYAPAQLVAALEPYMVRATTAEPGTIIPDYIPPPTHFAHHCVPDPTIAATGITHTTDPKFIPVHSSAAQGPPSPAAWLSTAPSAVLPHPTPDMPAFPTTALPSTLPSPAAVSHAAVGAAAAAASPAGATSSGRATSARHSRASHTMVTEDSDLDLPLPSSSAPSGQQGVVAKMVQHLHGRVVGAGGEYLSKGGAILGLGRVGGSIRTRHSLESGNPSAAAFHNSMDNPFARLAMQQQHQQHQHQQQQRQPQTQAIRGQQITEQSSSVFAPRHQQPTAVTHATQPQQSPGSGVAAPSGPPETGIPGSAVSGVPFQRTYDRQQQQEAGRGGGGGMKEPVALCVGSLPVQVPTRKSWGSKEVRVRPLTANPNLSPPSATPSPSLPTSKSSCPPTPIAPAAPAAAAAAAAAASTASNPQAAAPSQSIDAAQPHAHITPFASATPTMPWPSAPLACAPTPITGSAGFAPVHHVACGRQGVGEVGERHTVAVGDQGSPPSSVARGARAPSDEKHIRVCHEGPPGTHSSNSNDNPSSNGRSSSESSSGDSGGEGGRGWGAKGGGLAAGKRGSDGGVGGGGGWGTRVGGRRDAPASAPGPRGMLGLALHQQQQQERERARVLRHYPAHAGQQQQHQVQQHFQQHLLVSGTGGPAGTAGQRDEDAVVGRGKGQACVRTHGVASESPCRWASSGNTPWDGNPEAEGNGGDEGDDGHADGVAADDLEADTIVCGGFDGIPAHPAVGAEAAAGSEEGYAPRHGPQRPHVPANPTRPRRDPTSPRAAAAGTQPGVSQLESVGRPSLMPPLPPPSGAVAIHTTPATSAFHIRAHAHAHPHTHAHAQRVSSRGRSGSSRHSSGSYSRGGSSSAVAGMSLEREGGGVGEAEGVVSAGAVGGVFGLYTPGSSRRVSGDLMSSALPSPSFPLSCSPQLPFAFTPASQSVAGSLMKHALLGGTPPSAGSLPWHIHTPPTGRHPYSTRGALLKSSSRGRDPAPQPAEKGTTTAAAWEMGHRGGEEDSKSSSAGGDPGGAGSIVRARDVSLLALVRRPSWVEHSLRTRAGAGHGHADPITGSGGDNSISKCGEAAVHRSLSLGSVGDRTGVHAHAHAYAVQPRSPWGDGRQHTRDRAGVNLPLRPSYALPSYPSSFDRMPLLQLPSSFSSGPSSPFAGLGFPHGCSFTQHPNFLLPSHHLPALTGAPGSHASAAAAAAGAPTQPVCSYYHLPRVGPADQQQHQQQLLLMDVPGRSITHHGDASSPAGRCGVGRSSSGGGGFAADRQDSLEHTDSECPHFCCIMPPRANGISPASSPHLLHFPPSPNNLASRGFAYHPPLLQYWPQQQQPQHWLPLPAPGTGSTQPHSAEASVDADGRPHAENATAPDASTNAAAALQTRALLHHHQHQQQLGADCAVQDTRLFCGGAAAASLPAPLNLMHVLRETAAPSSPSAPQGYHATNPGDPGSQSTPLLLGLEGPSPLSPRRQQHEQQQEDGGGCGPGIAAFEPLLPFELDVRDWVGDTHKAEPACQQPHSIWQQRQQQQQTMLGGVGWWLTHGDRPEAQDRPGACGDNWDVGATEGATYNGSLHGVEHLAALLLKREHGACVGAFMEMLDMQGAQPLGPLVAPFPTHTLGERVPPELQLHTAGHSTASQPSHTAAKGSEHGGLGDEGSMSFKGDTPRSGSVCVGDALTEVAKLQEKLKALVKQSP
ncbi:hypothetical protein DUNSADRAFT_7863 [Dunaliella salina]|uniref:Autophagy-related protein 13 N-terminal domain-containing protein n=1 Tax=Dunaliella salina TaxID=3046 RepID=A0ABQ7GKK2_DUNSA|nr:hypothetical protein DUNSADRAFT_7863 [Dunaliella salina]|eukprot:KAF5835103.1 hypothetical protein DUNSADRAFT_7863 [Dunaliella salina]